jgi:hypothetical protein
MAILPTQVCHSGRVDWYHLNDIFVATKRKAFIVTTHDVVVVDNNQIDIDRACEEIGKAWYTTKQSLLRIVSLFRQCLDKKGFKELQIALEERGIIKAAVFSMFKTIAQNSLLDAPYADKLPLSYNAWYYLSRIYDLETFKSLIADGSINPAMTLEDAKRLQQQFSGESKERYKEPSNFVPIATAVKIRREDFKRNKKKISTLLDELESLGVVIKRGEDFQ